MRINQFIVIRSAVACSAATLMFSAVGCGKLESGANSTVSVKYLADGVAVAEAPAEGTTAQGEAPVGDAGGVGTLKGKVVYEGTFTALPNLYEKGGANKDPSVCGADAIPNQRILVKDGGLANAFVYLEKAPKGGKSADVTGPAVFDQKTCIFLPHAMVVRTKQTVTVLNADAAAHNTHTYPGKNSPFNSVVQPDDRVGVPLVYTQVEKKPLSVGCDIHPWMQAYHLPLDHSFAAVSKGDGVFEIKDLPAGKHEFKVWHEAGEFLEKSLVVTIKPGDNEITITVPASKLK